MPRKGKPTAAFLWSLFDTLSDSGGLVRVGVVLGHELTCLSASAHRLRLFSHMLPPF